LRPSVKPVRARGTPYNAMESGRSRKSLACGHEGAGGGGLHRQATSAAFFEVF
jgi:hypothetical protein